MSDPFELCLQFCLVKETGGDLLGGGYHNDPKDPGGETKFGICKRSYPNLDIKNLTYAQACEIYRKDYWEKVRGDEIPAPVALVMFEQALNQWSSFVGAVKCLQRALGTNPDGVFGERTMGALRRHTDMRKLVTELCQKRTEMYLTLNNETEERFEKGWIWRLLECQSLAIFWIYNGVQ